VSGLCFEGCEVLAALERTAVAPLCVQIWLVDRALPEGDGSPRRRVRVPDTRSL
jgi:hypothetical protein